MDGQAGEECIGATAQAVATVVYSARSLAHIEPAFQLLRNESPGAALDAAAAIPSAVDALAAHPLLGRLLQSKGPRIQTVRSSQQSRRIRPIRLCRTQTTRMPCPEGR